MPTPQRWLAVGGPGDYVKLLPTEGAGPDFFVKLNDHQAQVDRLRTSMVTLLEIIDSIDDDFEIKDRLEEVYAIGKRIGWGPDAECDVCGCRIEFIDEGGGYWTHAVWCECAPIDHGAVGPLT